MQINKQICYIYSNINTYEHKITLVTSLVQESLCLIIQMLVFLYASYKLF